MTDVVDEATETQEPQPVDAVTSFVVVMTLDGNISVVDSPLVNARPPSQADLKMISWFLNDQLNVNPPPPKPESQTEVIKKRLAQRKE